MQCVIVALKSTHTVSGVEEAKINNIFSSGRWGGGSGQSCNANHRQLYQCLFLSACFAAPSICNWICSIYHLVVAQLPAHFLPGSAGPRHNWMFLFRDRCQYAAVMWIISSSCVRVWGNFNMFHAMFPRHYIITHFEPEEEELGWSQVPQIVRGKYGS